MNKPFNEWNVSRGKSFTIVRNIGIVSVCVCSLKDVRNQISASDGTIKTSNHYKLYRKKSTCRTLFSVQSAGQRCIYRGVSERSGMPRKRDRGSDEAVCPKPGVDRRPLVSVLVTPDRLSDDNGTGLRTH